MEEKRCEEWSNIGGKQRQERMRDIKTVLQFEERKQNEERKRGEGRKWKERFEKRHNKKKRMIVWKKQRISEMEKRNLVEAKRGRREKGVNVIRMNDNEGEEEVKEKER